MEALFLAIALSPRYGKRKNADLVGRVSFGPCGDLIFSRDQGSTKLPPTEMGAAIDV